MRIVAFSDTEDKHEQLSVPDGDVLVFAGDMSRYGSQKSIENFNEWLGSLPHHDKIVVCGNHDTLFERNPSLGRSLMTNCHYLQDEGIEVGGLKFWGTPWQPWFHNFAFNLPRGEKLAEKWSLIPEDTEILITHTPPFGFGDNTWDGRKGCEDLRKRIAHLSNLKLHFFGHIHEEYGIFNDGRVVFCNVSWCPDRSPIVIDI